MESFRKHCMIVHKITRFYDSFMIFCRSRLNNSIAMPYRESVKRSIDWLSIAVRMQIAHYWPLGASLIWSWIKSNYVDPHNGVT